MKTKLHLCAALFAAFAMQGVASAAHQPGHPDKAAKSSGRDSARMTTTADDTPMMLRMARYPGRVGGTVLRTPRLIAETFGGERSLISKRGLFQTNETADSEMSRSVPQGRGQRTPAR